MFTQVRVVVVVLITTSLVVVSVAFSQPSRAQYFPYLYRQALSTGVWPSPDIQPLIDHNPYYIHGDFDGDGQTDLAMRVHNHENKRGLAIVHATLDTVYIIGAGEPILGINRELNEEYMRLLPRGRRLRQAFVSIPDLGITEGSPFEFDRDAIELGFVAKSAWALYFKVGKHYEIKLAD